jgi:hypothetical protein
VVRHSRASATAPTTTGADHTALAPR